MALACFRWRLFFTGGARLLLLLLLIFVDAVAAQTGIDAEIILLTGAPNSTNTTNQTGFDFTILASNTTLLLDSRRKPVSPGNSTATSTTDDGLSWWAWLMIGGGFFILILVLIVTAVFYSDYAKNLLGYKRLPPGSEGEAANTNARMGVKVIEVDLVHPCRGLASSAGNFMP
jgi:hypothetical protein